ncbi:MAG: hypothetical protein ABI051_00515 [Vicinamibacterales bacterium]
MDMDTVHRRPVPIEFVVRALAGSLLLFAVLRLGVIETHLVLPVTRAQGWAAAHLFGAPTATIVTTAACSGADALALCLAAILAYPVAWGRRLAGSACGVALVLVLNTARIGTLGLVAARPVTFSVLHLYIWPAVLTLAIASYVFGWMRYAERRTTHEAQVLPHSWRRFVPLTLVFLVVFVAASPIYLQSASVFALGGLVASAAAASLTVAGVSAHAAGNVLWTRAGGVLVTQECILTPVIPVYLAAVCSWTRTWPRRALGIAAALPLFAALAVVRLLVVALPGVTPTSLFFVHAFFQLLVGVVLVCGAALWRHRGVAAMGYALAGLSAAVLFMVVCGPLYRQLAPVGWSDPQGAMALLPPFQIALFLGLWIATCYPTAWTGLGAGMALLSVTQVATLMILVAAGTAGQPALHVRDVRGWAVVAPVLMLAAVIRRARPTR